MAPAKLVFCGSSVIIPGEYRLWCFGSPLHIGCLTRLLGCNKLKPTKLSPTRYCFSEIMMLVVRHMNPSQVLSFPHFGWHDTHVVFLPKRSTLSVNPAYFASCYGLHSLCASSAFTDLLYHALPLKMCLLLFDLQLLPYDQVTLKVVSSRQQLCRSGWYGGPRTVQENDPLQACRRGPAENEKNG